MSNKTQLQANNENLASILSDVLGLPSQESLKHGAYVWKKYGTTSKYVENSNEFYRKVLTTEPQNGAITYERSSTYTFDESTGLFTLGTGNSGSIAYGSYGKIDTPSDYYMIGTRTGTTMYKNDGTAQVPDLYNNAGGVIILAYNDSHLVTEYQSELIYEKSDFIDFVVSDSPTAYPDGGEQDGYWYEKVVEGKTGIDYGEISIVDSSLQTLTINHSLGVAPSIAVVYPKNATIYRNETKAFFGSFGATLTVISTPFISPIWSCNISNNNPYLSNSVGGNAYGSSTATADTISITPVSYWVTGTYIWFAIA